MEKSDPKRFLAYLDAERKASLLYLALADTVSGERREALIELAGVEEEHAAHWVAKLEEYGVPIPPAPTRVDPKDARLIARARAAGIDGILSDLEQAEGQGAGMYDNEPEALATMSAEEREHAEWFRAMKRAPAPDVSRASATIPTEKWHRGDRSGATRAAVFGISDGLVSNTALVMGFAGAAPSNGTILFAGLAGLLAGAFSMAAGEYVSVASQRDLFRREINLEAAELRDKPEEEQRELELIYRAKGLTRETAAATAAQIMANPARALDTLTREELGLNPDELGSPVKVALSSFISFAIGACVVVIPYLFFTAPTSSTTVPLYLAIGLSVLALLLVGGVVGRLSGRGILFSAIRQLCWGGGAAIITHLVGRVVGVSIS